MKKTFLILGLVVITPAMAELPTVGYISEYLKQICHNPDINSERENPDNLISHRGVLTIVDELNANNVDYFTGAAKPTSYATTVRTDSVVGTDYLHNLNSKLNWVDGCCIDGTRDANTGECSACGTWTRDNDATKCPDGWTHVELNAVMVNTGDACPSDMMPYFEIPDDCENSIF